MNTSNKRGTTQLSPNPAAFVYNANNRVYKPEEIAYTIVGQQPHSMLIYNYADALALTTHYAKLAKTVKRVFRGKIQKVEFHIDTLKLLLKSLIFCTSEIECGVVESIQRLTGWEYGQIQKGLNDLAQENFIERRRAVSPNQIVRRW